MERRRSQFSWGGKDFDEHGLSAFSNYNPYWGVVKVWELGIYEVWVQQIRHQFRKAETPCSIPPFPSSQPNHFQQQTMLQIHCMITHRSLSYINRLSQWVFLDFIQLDKHCIDQQYSCNACKRPTFIIPTTTTSMNHK